MLDYAQLDAEIKKIIELADKQPEKYQVSCFETLLESVLLGSMARVIPDKVSPSAPTTGQNIDLPIDVKAFLMQFTIPEQAINKLFLIHGKEIRPIYQIVEEKKGTAQMQIALLTALENALKSEDSKFEFSIERVRTLTKDQDKFDDSNFQTTFKKNAKLFMSLTDPEHVQLSALGKSELADVVAELTR